MNYKVLAFVIALSIVLMGSVLFVVVSQGAQTAKQEVLAQQAELGLHSPTVQRGLFSFTTPTYAVQNVSCNTPPFMQEAYINLVLRYRETPRSCSYWVNDRYVRTDRELAPNCVRECPVGEFSRSTPLGEYDMRDLHKVRVCCNDICVEAALQPLCEVSGESRRSFR